MMLYPAIDVKEGACVRLFKGDMNQSTVFSHSPAEQAKAFEDAGFRFLHMVDLNGAFAGAPVNKQAVEAVLKTVKLPVQLGGGIRDMATIEMWLNAGIARVILGTVALKNPALVRDACKAFAGRIAVGIDAKNGYVAVEGWAESSRIRALDLALCFEDAGVSAIIYTDIDRDGTKTGANIEATAALAEKLTTPVIISGGVASVADIKAAKLHEASGIEGIILGRALYDGAIDPEEALQVAA